MSAAVAANATKKGFARKMVDGKMVLRDRTKAALWGAGALAVVTPLGGSLISGMAGQAAKNTSMTAGAIGQGAFDGMFEQAPVSILSCFCSSSSIIIVAILLMMLR